MVFSVFLAHLLVVFPLSLLNGDSSEGLLQTYYIALENKTRGLQERKYREVGSMRSIWRVGEHARMAALGQRSHVE